MPADPEEIGKADPRFAAAFPKLTDAHIKALSAFGNEQTYQPGEVVWEAGQPNLCMFVVISGSMGIQDGRTHLPVATHEAGAFSGDIDVLSGRPVVVSAVANTELKVLQIDADCVRSIVGEHPDLGEIILRAFLTRRAMLQEAEGIGILVMGSRYSAETLRIREFLARNRYPFTWQDLEGSPDVNKLLQEFHVTEDDTPVVVLQDGLVLRSPANAELGSALGINQHIEGEIFDLVVIGAGPAGLAAGVYGGSEGLSTLIVDENGPGGQAGASSRIENYMGFPTGLTGQDLADRAVAQAEKFGTKFMVPATVKDVVCSQVGTHFVDLGEGGRIDAKCVILATGANYRKLDVDNYQKYEGRGIYYSATQVERILCGTSQVAVVGAGNSAGQAAIFLSDTAGHVFLVVRGSDLRKTMSSYLATRIERSEKITVLLESEICQIDGAEYLEAMHVKGKAEVKTEPVSGIFVMIGAVPHTDWLPDNVARDGKGFVLTGQDLVERGLWKLDRPPFYLETSCPGVFAAGDARASSVKRVASAVGEGSMAVAFVHQFLAL